MTSLLGQALMVAGAALLVVAMVGVLRLPDTLARQHAGTKAATLALGLMALGLGLVTPNVGTWSRLALLIVALWATLPVASHALARAAISRANKAARNS
jgi:multicomponent Na+:H+ antiporter subunit G